MNALHRVDALAVFRERRVVGRLFAVAAALAMAATACGGSASTGGAATGDPYQVGFTSDFSDQFGYLGLGLKAGANTYFDALNKSGGINGHPVKLTALDDANQSTQGVANVTQLITQYQVSAVIGFQSSVVTAAVAPLAAQYKVPVISSTVSAALVQPPLPYVFAATLQTADYAAPQMQYAKQLMASKAAGTKIKVASITTTNSAALQQWQDSVRKIADAYGWQVVDQELVPYNSIDMSANLAKIEATNPDVLLMAIGSDSWIVPGMKQIDADGKSFPVVSYDSPTWNTVQTINSSRFYYVSALSYASSSTTPQFYKDAKAANQDPNGPYIIRGYYEALIAAQALKRCGFPCSGDKMQAALDKTSADTAGIIQGNVQYDPKNHEGVRDMAAYQWDGSKSQPVVTAKNLKPGTTAS